LHSSLLLTFDNNVTYFQSTIRAFVLGEDIPIPPSHTAGFRWLTHASDLDPYPELDWIVKTPPLGARLISAPIVPAKAGTKVDHRTIVIYACRGGRLVNVLGIHEDLRDQDSVGA
jgi:salicylate hydroxylase